MKKSMTKSSKKRICITIDTFIVDQLEGIIDELNDQNAEGRRLTLSSVSELLYKDFLERSYGLID